jgi:hypothetical protein
MLPFYKRIDLMFTDCKHTASLNVCNHVPCLNLSDTSFQMPRAHLRQVHEQFHCNALEVSGNHKYVHLILFCFVSHMIGICYGRLIFPIYGCNFHDLNY